MTPFWTAECRAPRWRRSLRMRAWWRNGARATTSSVSVRGRSSSTAISSKSLAPLSHMGERGRLLDVGSGAGIPGVPLLCALPGWTGTLLEPRQKRWAFLKMVIRELSLEADVVKERYSDWSGARVDLVTARAVGGHEALLKWARTRLTEDGAVALWATDAEEELFREHPGWHVLSSPIPSLDRGRLIRFQVCFT